MTHFVCPEGDWSFDSDAEDLTDDYVRMFLHEQQHIPYDQA